MVGDTDTTVSPSSSSTSLSTPCVLGCCGPMLTVIVSVRTSAMCQLGTAHDNWPRWHDGTKNLATLANIFVNFVITRRQI